MLYNNVSLILPTGLCLLIYYHRIKEQKYDKKYQIQNLIGYL